MQRSDALAEADRLMTVCNSCRYCEGLCPVFPSMELRRVFADGDLNFLANLCHNCGACYDDCQFTPPHEFAVNVPRTLARVRRQSYETYAWPRPLAGLFRRNGLAVSLVLAASVAIFIAAFVAVREPAVLFSRDAGPGAFYRLMPHGLMATMFGGAFVYAVVALSMGVRSFWRDANASDPQPLTAGALWRAIKDAGSLRHLDGGGVGCMNADERPRDHRRFFHHLVFYGFLLCFASTAAASLYHYLLGREAPYAWRDAPVVLGVAGGAGLVIGAAGLLLARLRRRAELRDEAQVGMDVAFTVTVLLSGLTGLALLALRSTPAMGLLLALHLGVIFAFFATLPYSRFVHGLYRFAALVRHAREMAQQQRGGEA
jgi:citrate/tricarballylate utilization protein